jgi:hypothetical protein
MGAVRRLGTERGLDMLQPLATPFDSASLHERVATLARKTAQREPVIDAPHCRSRSRGQKNFFRKGIGWKSSLRYVH